MSKCLPSPPIVTSPESQPEKIWRECGTEFIVCGWGEHFISMHMGKISGDVVVWFDKNYEDDDLTVFHGDEIVGAAPANQRTGSFTFKYDPNAGGAAAGDEIVFHFINRHLDSEWKIRVDCIKELVDDPIDFIAPKEIETVCGKQVKIAGYAKRTYIDMGKVAGQSEVSWAVEGSAEMLIYHGDKLLLRGTPNRFGTFKFKYDPNLPVYVDIIGSIGKVKFLFACPVLSEEELANSFVMNCGEQEMLFEAQNLIRVVFDDFSKGAVEVLVQTPESVELEFVQAGKLLHTIRSYDGTTTFTFDHEPENGELIITAKGYGEFSLMVKCPYVEPEVGEKPISVYRVTCYDEAPAELPVFEPPAVIYIEGLQKSYEDLVANYTIEGVTGITLKNGFENLGQGYPMDGARSLNFDYDHNLGNLRVEAEGTDPFSFWLQCPPPEPVSYTHPCGTGPVEFDMPGDITLHQFYHEDEFTITSSHEIAVYKNDALAGIVPAESTVEFTNLLGDRWRLVSGENKNVTIDVTCPGPDLYEIACDSGEQTFDMPGTIRIKPFAYPGRFTIKSDTALPLHKAVPQGDPVFVGILQPGVKENFIHENLDETWSMFTNDNVDVTVEVTCPVRLLYLGCNEGEKTFRFPAEITLNSFTYENEFIVVADGEVDIYKNGVLVQTTVPNEPVTLNHTFDTVWMIASYEDKEVKISNINCPAQPPQLHEIECGTGPQTFDMPGTVKILEFEEVNKSEFTVTVDKVASLYRDGVLEAVFEPNVAKTIRHSGNPVWQIINMADEDMTVDVTCPIRVYDCNDSYFGNVETDDEPMEVRIAPLDLEEYPEDAAFGVLITYKTTETATLEFSPAVDALGEGSVTVSNATIGQVFIPYVNEMGNIFVSTSGTGEYTYAVGCPILAMPGSPGGDGEEVDLPQIEDALDPETPPEERTEFKCAEDGDVYEVEKHLSSDLEKPVASAGTQCALNLTGRVHAHKSKTASDVFGATLVTMVRDLTGNRFAGTKTGAEFNYWYELPIVLEPGDYTFVLKADEADCEVGMFLDCYPILDRARNKTIRLDVAVLTRTSFMQINWHYPDSIVDQDQRTGGIYAAIAKTATGEIIWRTGDRVDEMRHNAPLKCEDVPIWVTIEDMSEQVPCPSGETKNGIYGEVNYLTATWQRITKSTGEVKETEKVFDGVCAVPPHVVTEEQIDVSRECPSGQTYEGVWKGTTTQPGFFIRKTWSDGKVEDSDTTWLGFCEVPIEVVTLVRSEKITITQNCPSGETLRGERNSVKYITGYYMKHFWSNNTTTQDQPVFPSDQYCAVPEKYIVSQSNKVKYQTCPDGQTVNGVPGGTNKISGTYVEYKWSDGTVTEGPVTWESGKTCAVPSSDPNVLNPPATGGTYSPPVGGAVGTCAYYTYSHYDGRTYHCCNKANLGGGRILNAQEKTLWGAFNFSNNAILTAGAMDSYGGRRIVFSSDPNVKPVAKTYHVCVPIGVAVSVGSDVCLRVEIFASGVTVSTPDIHKTPTTTKLVPRKGCTNMVPIIAQCYDCSDPISVSWIKDGDNKYVARIGATLSQYNNVTCNKCSCSVSASSKYLTDAIVFRVSVPSNVASGLAGFSFALIDQRTGAVFYRSGDANNIKVTA